MQSGKETDKNDFTMQRFQLKKIIHKKKERYFGENIAENKSNPN